MTTMKTLPGVSPSKRRNTKEEQQRWNCERRSNKEEKDINLEGCRKGENIFPSENAARPVVFDLFICFSLKLSNGIAKVRGLLYITRVTWLDETETPKASTLGRFRRYGTMKHRYKETSRSNWRNNTIRWRPASVNEFLSSSVPARLFAPASISVSSIRVTRMRTVTRQNSLPAGI